MKRKTFKKIAALGMSILLSTSFLSSVAATDFSDGESISTENIFTDSDGISVMSSSGNSPELSGNTEIPYIITTGLPTATVGEPYSFQLEGGSHDGSPIKWSIGEGESLPKGLSLSSDGLISGIPVKREDKNSIVLVADNGKATAEISVYMSAVGPETDFGLESNWKEHDFGIIYPGTAHNAKLVLANSGRNPLHFMELPKCQYYDIRIQTGRLDELLPAYPLSLDISPKQSLTRGTYEEQIIFRTKERIEFAVSVKVTVGSTSQKDYELLIDSPEILFKEPWANELKIINNGQKSTRLKVDSSKLTHFTLEDSYINQDIYDKWKENRSLKPGESVTFSIVPNNPDEKYSDELSFYIDDGSKYTVSVKQTPENTAFRKYLEVSKTDISFETKYKYYDTAPQAETITVKNISDKAITLTQNSSQGLLMSKSGKSVLQPGETTEFTLCPCIGLDVGEYKWEPYIYAKCDGKIVDRQFITISFAVSDFYIAEIGEIPPRRGIAHGTPKTAEGLKLPEFAMIYLGDEKWEDYLPINWKVEECPYDPKKNEEQNFIVEGELNSWRPETNTLHLELKVTANVQVRAYSPLAQPVINKANVTDNYADISLMSTSDEATGYQYVLVENPSDLQAGKYVYEKNSASINVRFQYINKGDYLLFCRAYRKSGSKITYGDWSEEAPVSIKAYTAQAPVIKKVEVKNCDILLTIETPEKVDGFDAVLAEGKNDNTPVNYHKVRKDLNGNTKTILIRGAKNGTYYAGVHSYIRQDRKVLSKWSNLIKVTVKNGLISSSPVIKKTSVSGKSVKASVSLPKGASGADWILSKSCYTYTDGEDNKLYGPMGGNLYVLKDRQKNTITFKNIKPGTYYLMGHAYVKGYKKSFTEWSKPKKIIVK